MAVPVLDFTHFLDEADSSQQEAAYADMTDALSNFGFVKFINHGISEAEVHEMFSWSRRFFGLPPEAKIKATKQPPEAVPYRGWVRQGLENSTGVTHFINGRMPFKEGKVDLKEAFDSGAPHNPQLPNLWPSESDLPGFRAFCEPFYKKCICIRLGVLRAIARSLNLPPTAFDAQCNPESGYSALRLLHYPETSVQALTRDGFKRVAEHSDTGDLTMLFQDSVGGLELEDQHHPGTFWPVQNTKGEEMLVNVADMLQRWTNGRLRSACHRVVLPESLKEAVDGKVPARYSIAVLGKPERTTSVGPMPQFVGEKTPAVYDEMTAWDYQRWKYNFLYSVKETKAEA